MNFNFTALFDATFDEHISPGECCCDQVLFDGTCIGGHEDTIIAHCSKILNMTYAQCTWATNNEDVQCFLEACWQKRGKPLTSFQIPIIIGAVFLIGAVIHNCYTIALDNSRPSWKRKFMFIQPRGSTRICQELGLSLIILGYAIEHYDDAFTVAYIIAFIPSVLTLFFVFYTLCSKDILEDKEQSQVVNIYQDFGASIPRLYVTFFSQFCLLSVYLYQVDHGEEPNFSTPECYFYYILGALVQVGYNKAKSDEREGYLHYWLNAILHVQAEDRSIFIKIRVLGRWFCSFLINNLGCDLIIILLPMHLTQSGSPMDFVLNAVAAYFITEIDDLGDSTPVENWKAEFDKMEIWSREEPSDEEDRVLIQQETEETSTVYYDTSLNTKDLDEEEKGFIQK